MIHSLIRLLLQPDAPVPASRNGLRARLVTMLLIAVAIAVGSGFLVASGYLALRAVWPAHLAALTMGLSLVAAALVVLGIASLLNGASMAGATNSEKKTAVTAIEEVPLSDSPDLVVARLESIVREARPMTLLAVGLGLLYGLFGPSLRRRV